MNDPSPWLRLAEPALQTLRVLFAWLPKRSKDHLIFVEQPLSSWAYLVEPSGAGIQLHVLLHVTNDSTADGLIISRVQVRQTGWRFLFHKDPWQDCMMVDVGDQRLMPMMVGPALPPRTTAVMNILHHHKAKRPAPMRPIRFHLRVTDQSKRVHLSALKVPPR